MTSPHPDVCVSYLLRTSPSGVREVLLGEKLRGLGEGRLVAPGGKLEPGESPAEAAVREIREESGLTVALDALEPMGMLDYRFPHRPAWSQRSWVFRVTEFSGTPVASDELVPRWFPVDAVPVDRMWDDARYWLPEVLRSARPVNARFDFGADLRTVVAATHPEFPGPARTPTAP